MVLGEVFLSGCRTFCMADLNRSAYKVPSHLRERSQLLYLKALFWDCCYFQSTLMIFLLPLATNVDVNLYADDTELHFCQTTEVHSSVCCYRAFYLAGCQQVETECSKILMHAHWDPTTNLWEDITSITWQCSTETGLNSTVWYLGVYIDQHLTWHHHVEYILHRVCGKLYSINCLKPLTSKVMKLRIVSGTCFTNYWLLWCYVGAY